MMRLTLAALSLLVHAPVAVAESAAAESAAAERDQATPGKAKPQKKKAKSKARSIQSIKLKDGNILNGLIIAQDRDTVTLKTSLGTIKVPKRSIDISRVILELDDNTVLVGKLIAQSQDDYSVMTSFGVVKVKRSRVLRLTTKESRGQQRRSRTQHVIGSSSGAAISRIGRPSGEFSHTIEPLIDVFFDPTGYTFKKGDLYLSGLSFAVGLSDKTLISSNLVELSGLASAFSTSRGGVSVNPNFELKHQLKFERSAKKEWALSTGLTYQLNALNGRVNNGELQRRNTQMGTRAYGWRTQAYVANTVSWLRENGQGRISWHAGFRGELNHFNIKDYGELFSYRLYNGFDVDLNRQIKLIGEVFYDPDFENYLTQEKYWGADIGVMFALSENFRFLLHTHPYFVGLYWRF
jgi:small nuclear ribonucleoprotein (snRNP)-like protein